MSKGTVFILTAPENFAYYRAIPLWEQKVEFHPLDGSFGAIQQGGADILLLDSDVNAGRGLSLLHEIKAARPEIMVIFVTAILSEDTAIQAFRQGARDYFRKPLDLLKLKDVIENLLKIKGVSSEKRTHHGSAGTAASGTSVLLLNDTPANLLRSIHYIEKNFTAALTIEQLAEEAGISRFHYCRKFKKHTGMSPMHFVTLMRIERAKGLLGSSIPVSAVAFKVGFNDLGNFIRSFKKVTGQTPSAYKKIDSSS